MYKKGRAGDDASPALANQIDCRPFRAGALLAKNTRLCPVMSHSSELTANGG